MRSKKKEEGSKSFIHFEGKCSHMFEVHRRTERGRGRDKERGRGRERERERGRGVG